MSEESTSPKPKKKATIKVAKAKGGNVDVVFDLAIKGMLLVQIILAFTAFLYEFDFATDDANDVAGTIIFATFLSYVAIVAIVYSLSLLIGNQSKSPITRIFAFGYYILLLGILFQAATDPAGGVTAAIAGGF